MERRLYRSRTDRMIAGVCGGIAAYSGWDPTLVRIAAVAISLVTSGGIVIAYIVLAIVVPEEPGEGYAHGSPFTMPPYDTGVQWGQQPGSNSGSAAANQPAPPSATVVPPAPPVPDAPFVPAPGEASADMPEEGMGPGDMPEPGEYDEPIAADAAPTEPIAPADSATTAPIAPPVPPEAGAYQAPPVPPTPAQQWASQAPSHPHVPTYGPQRRDRRGGVVGGVVLVVIGGVLLAGQFTGIGFSQLWPLVLVAIGLAIIFSRRD